MGIALVLLLATPVAASADPITPGYQPGRSQRKSVPPRWGTPGPDRLGGSSADHCSGKEQRGTRNLLHYLDPLEAVGRLGARLILQQALEDEVSEPRAGAHVRPTTATSSSRSRISVKPT